MTKQDESWIEKLVLPDLKSKDPIDYDVYLSDEYFSITLDDMDMVKKFLQRNNSSTIVIAADNFNLYYPEDIDENGKLDDICQEDVGSHAMTVVDVFDDGKLVVSSWGRKYILNLKENEIFDYVIYDYSKK